MMIFPAHIGGERVQTVQEHSRSAARYASRCLAPIGLDKAGYLAALIHDCGKYTAAYKTYLERAAAGEPARRGSVIHTHGAARFLLEQFHSADGCLSARDMTAELLAYAASAHHGLFDCVDEFHHSGFSHRLAWDDACYQESRREFLLQCAGLEEITDLFDRAHRELEPIYQWINDQPGNEDIFFHLGLLSRLLLSAVIDGDRKDTAGWMAGAPLCLPPVPDWSLLLERVETRLNEFPCDSPIQAARRRISQQCREAAERGGGIYRLNVPTGGGKTLSALRFALAHAARNGNSRIIFTSPLLSILDQNADVLRKYIGDDSLILEHHSNVVRDVPAGEELDPRELLCESWAAPIIITTMTQLLNTLFAGQTSCVRRFQALCGCILVIDEVQTVPVRMLSLFNLALNFLAHVCGATILLCSATQPCLEAAAHPLSDVPEDLVPYAPDLWAPFRRTRLIDAGTLRLDEMPEFIRARSEGSDSLLVVCNLKAQARFLYRQLRRPDTACFHLSAAMCQAHRKEVLARMREALDCSRNGGPKVICISTQVIEAGVDISFGCVIRLTAGMDNAVQAAGRCNRNGESAHPVPVFLLTCSDEALGRLREIQTAKTAAQQLLSAFHRDPARFDDDLTSDSAIRLYYRNLYAGTGSDGQDYPIKGGGSLFDLLSVNEMYALGRPDMERFGLHQAFRQAGHIFQVFDQETFDVLVPYREGSELIHELGSQAVQRDLGRQKKLLERAKPFSVSLHRGQKELLERKGGLHRYLGGTVLAAASYDVEVGLIPEPGDMEFLEV